MLGDRHIGTPAVDEPCDFKRSRGLGGWRTGGTVIAIHGRDFHVRDEHGETWTTRQVRRPKAPAPTRSSKAEGQRRAMRDACFAIDVPRGGTARVHGDPSMSPESRAALGEILRAATDRLAPARAKKLPTVRTSIEGLHQRAPWRSPEYLAFVREHPCCVCQRDAPSDPHHFGPRGTATKTDDSMAVPLCRIDHDAFHRTGIAPGCVSRLATEALFYRVQARLLTAWIKRSEAPL